jgi:hypothetical protein
VVVAIMVVALGIAIRVGRDDEPFPVPTPATPPDPIYILRPDPLRPGDVPAPAWTPRRQASPPVPAGPGTLAADQAAILSGAAGERLLITPTRPLDPVTHFVPAPGHQVVQVDVHIENTGEVPFLVNVERYTWLIDRRGNAYGRDVARTVSVNPVPFYLTDRGAQADRTIVFELDQKLEVTGFRLSLSRRPGVAGRSQDWQLTY